MEVYRELKRAIINVRVRWGCQLITTRAIPVAKVPGCFTTQSPVLAMHLLLPAGGRPMISYSTKLSSPDQRTTLSTDWEFLDHSTEIAKCSVLLPPTLVGVCACACACVCVYGYVCVRT